MKQISLPRKYIGMTNDELAGAITERKERLGGRLCILGHHYQRDEVIRFADLTGDSLKLSQQAAEQGDAEYIVFCGVHFMAESADLLSADNQAVCLPHMDAGCSMADMAGADAVATAISRLAELSDARIIPVTYVNSTAAVKSATGLAGGACCTSSNVRNVFQWALADTEQGGAGGDKILAIPDRHLGLNTAVAMGYRPEDTVVYDPALPDGGLSAQDIARATFILWKGHCYVHQLFTVQDITRVRQEHPDIRIIVHPECPHEVVRLTDASGSTEQIIRAVAAGKPGSKWAIGTESNLVSRLADRHVDMFIRVLSDKPALCRQMARIDLPHLLWMLDNLAEGNVVNRITVADEVADGARQALRRMIDIKAVKEVTPGGLG